MHLVAWIKLMRLFRIEFQMCVVNCSFAYIMVHNLEPNFLKILINQKIEIEVGEKEKTKANLSEAQKKIENEAIKKRNEKLTCLLTFFMMVSTFCILVILEEFARSFGENYLMKY